MVRALSTAQTQSVREIKKNADIKKVNKNISVIVVAIFVVLILAGVGYKVYNYYQSTRFDFKETEYGVVFNSKDMAIKDSINTILDANQIILYTTIIQGDQNTIADGTEALVLFTTILTAKGEKTITLIGTLDEKRELLNCHTNHGDVFTDVEITSQECMDMLSVSESAIQIDVPNSKLSASTVNLYPLEKRAYIKPKTRDAVMISTYLFLKSQYPDLEETLSHVESIKEKLAALNQLSDLNATMDNNSVQDNNAAVDGNLEIDTNN